MAKKLKGRARAIDLVAGLLVIGLIFGAFPIGKRPIKKEPN